MPSENESLSAEELLKIVLDAIPLRVFWKNCQLEYLGANQKLIDDIGFECIDDLIGKSDYDIFDTPEEAEPKRSDDRKVIASGKPKLNIEEPLPIQGKKEKWLRTNKVPMRTPDGKIIGILGTYQDITEEVEYRKQIEIQALVDPLTNLANRRSLQNQINKTHYCCAGLLFIDLDEFKQVNDTLGHTVGDNLLLHVANRFQAVANKYNATLARLGGDEFAIFVTYNSNHNVKQKLAEIAESTQSATNIPIEIEEHVINVGASIGVTIIDKQKGKKTTSDSFTEADLAMYDSKVKGGNQYSFFVDSLKTSAQRKHVLSSSLTTAIANQELYLVYQPQVNAHNQIVGAEALIRWEHKKLGNIPPSEFIPIAEESGTISKIGQWVILQALKDASRWQTLIGQVPHFKLAINVSSKQFYDKTIVEYIKRQLVENNFDAKHLEIEITESLLLERKRDAIAAINEIKNLGVSIAIDDFGTGYSSLSYLAVLPINKLKIDRTFTKELQDNSTNRKLIQAMVSLANSLKLAIIAEGVESQSELQELKKLKCFEYQGYYFDKPLQTSEFTAKFNRAQV